MLKAKVFDTFPELETKRLYLRELKMTDDKDLFEVFSSSEVMKYYNLYPFDSLAQAKELINNYLNSFQEEKVLKWGIEYKKEQKLIGSCEFYNWQEEFSRATLGYELNAQYWQHGFMTEALEEIIHFGFQKMKLNRIQALVEPPNQASRNLLTDLGFKKEGLLRDYMFYKGEYKDLFMYSLLKRDFTFVSDTNVNKKSVKN